MRRILLALMSTVAAVVLLFGYRTSTPDPALGVTTTIAAGDGMSAGSGASGATPAPPGGSSSNGSDSEQTVTGRAVQTRWGPVQVQITISGGTIIAAEAVQVPSGNRRDVEINHQAIPVLTQEALTAQGAEIDSVSGATYTSQGYIESLQSALDQAGL